MAGDGSAAEMSAVFAELQALQRKLESLVSRVHDRDDLVRWSDVERELARSALAERGKAKR